ncbi:hypothetical protein RhiirA4_480380 [Rhizophagus irregularis]|uniref:Uncharacterized protein n=1 Tax=Rhizophagus irregularis TaxID=588596 RepID=A0A2I1HHV0_9GLOM|nr:hypothetical protein RhiirA4_480380 [Rhizophagus irregularis]
MKRNVIHTYRDGIAVVHLIKPINESCIEPRIDLRILHPNGTIDSAKVDYPIPEYNFCLGPSEQFYWYEKAEKTYKQAVEHYREAEEAFWQDCTDGSRPTDVFAKAYQEKNTRFEEIIAIERAILCCGKKLIKENTSG